MRKCQTTRSIALQQCLICLEEFTVDKMYTLHCSRSHRFCIDCLSTHVINAALGDKDTAPFIPRCPLANGKSGCAYSITETEAQEMLDECYKGQPLKSKTKKTVTLRTAQLVSRSISNLTAVGILK